MRGDQVTVVRPPAAVTEGPLVLFELLCGRTRVLSPGVESGAG